MNCLDSKTDNKKIANDKVEKYIFPFRFFGDKKIKFIAKIFSIGKWKNLL